MELTKKDHIIMMETYYEIDEVFVDDRKGVAQTRYIIEIKEDAEYYNPDKHDREVVPNYLVGFWMQEFADDNRYQSPNDLLGQGYEVWVKCKRVQVVVDSWEQV